MYPTDLIGMQLKVLIIWSIFQIGCFSHVPTRIINAVVFYVVMWCNCTGSRLSNNLTLLKISLNEHCPLFSAIE